MTKILSGYNKDIYEVNVSMTEWMIDHFENLKI